MVALGMTGVGFIKQVTISAALLTVLLAGSGAKAQNDITYGGDARSFSMGGAGIALMQQQAGFRMNPATLAYEPKTVGFQFPSLAIRSQGAISQGRITNYLFNGQDSSDALVLARESSKEDSVIGANGSVSLRYSHYEIGAQAVARGRIQPNGPLRAWANGPTSQPLPENTRADILAAGYYTFPTIAAGILVPTPKQSRYSYAVGGRIKYINGVYSHYIADAEAVAGLRGPQLAPEMGGRDTLNKKGAAVDLGVMMQPRRGNRDFTAAVVIENAVKTPIKFRGTDRDGNPKNYDILATTFTAGAAYQKGGFTAAADLADITNSAGGMQLRMGTEYKFNYQLAVRGGYNTATGFVVGVGFFGLDVAFGKNQPLEVVKTLHF